MRIPKSAHNICAGNPRVRLKRKDRPKELLCWLLKKQTIVSEINNACRGEQAEVKRCIDVDRTSSILSPTN